MRKIRPAQLSSVIREITLEYKDKVDDAIRESSLELAKEGRKELRNASPKNRGKYRQGWSYRKTTYGAEIYNKTHAKLTHLLEYGHALRQGGRSPAIKHIEPVHDALEPKFERIVKERLEQIK